MRSVRCGLTVTLLAAAVCLNSCTGVRHGRYQLVVAPGSPPLKYLCDTATGRVWMQGTGETWNVVSTHGLDLKR
jgi:hypothetical protein